MEGAREGREASMCGGESTSERRRRASEWLDGCCRHARATTSTSPPPSLLPPSPLAPRVSAPPAAASASVAVSVIVFRVSPCRQQREPRLLSLSLSLASRLFPRTRSHAFCAATGSSSGDSRDKEIQVQWICCYFCRSLSLSLSLSQDSWSSTNALT